MCRTLDLQQAVLARNDDSARELRAALAARGTVAVNLLSSPGSGKTALLELELGRARERGVPVAALTADLATENDATRLARSGVPVKQVLTDGLCHLEAVMLAGHLEGWLPEPTRLLFVENVGNLVCPASYDLGESLRVVLASVTEGRTSRSSTPPPSAWPTWWWSPRRTWRRPWTSTRRGSGPMSRGSTPASRCCSARPAPVRGGHAAGPGAGGAGRRAGAPAGDGAADRPRPRARS